MSELIVHNVGCPNDIDLLWWSGRERESEKNVWTLKLIDYIFILLNPEDESLPAFEVSAWIEALCKRGSFDFTEANRERIHISNYGTGLFFFSLSWFQITNQQRNSMFKKFAVDDWIYIFVDFCFRNFVWYFNTLAIALLTPIFRC